MLPALFGGLGTASHSTILSTPRTEAPSPAATLVPDGGSQEHAATAASIASTQQGIPSQVVFIYPNVPQAPCGRWAHVACAFSGPSPCMVVHGGIGSTLLDDTVVLDAAMCWRTVSTYAAGPKDRPEKVMGHAAAAVGRRMWMFGGQQGRKLLSKLYCYDVDSCTWKRHSPDSLPCARAGAAMVAVGTSIYLMGGQGKKLLSDLWVFDTNHPAGGFRQLPERGRVPTPRRGHSLAWDGGDNLICLGGTTPSGIDAQLAVFSISRQEWFAPSTTGPAPTARTQHSATMVASNAMMVFGGCNAQGHFFNDTYILDTSNWTWSRPQMLNAVPAPRYHHSSVMLNGKCLIYGGINSKQTFEGVVVVEMRGDHDLSHIVEELTAMTSGAVANGGLGAFAAAAGSGALGAGGALSALSGLSAMGMSLATSTQQSREGSHTPRMDPSVQGGTAGMRAVSSSTMLMDAMKSQLTDLLVKRNMEEMQLQAARKAEAVEASLLAERARNEALNKELMQLRLMAAEAEGERDAWAARSKEAASKLEKESAALAAAQAQAAALTAQLETANSELAAARSLQEGMLKELGILSSRYTRLHQQMRARRSRRADDSSAGPAAAGSLHGQATQQQQSQQRSALSTGTGPSGQSRESPSAVSPRSTTARSNQSSVRLGSGESGAQEGEEPYDTESSELELTYPRLDVAGAAASMALVERLGLGDTSGLPSLVAELLAHMQQVPDSTGPAGLTSQSCDGAGPATGISTTSTAELPSAGLSGSACQQLLRLLTAVEAQRASSAEEVAGLQAALDAAAAARDAASAKVAALEAEGEALAHMPLSALAELEAQIERSARTVRETVLQRTIQEAAARASSEQAACALCLERPKSVVFNCGHQMCAPCGAKLDLCPFCRATITTRIKLFDV